MCRWIADGVREFDASPLRTARLSVPHASGAGKVGAGKDTQRSSVGGLDALFAHASIKGDVSQLLQDEVAQLGAVHVLELTAADWLGLPSWSRLRPLEQRRLLSHASQMSP